MLRVVFAGGLRGASIVDSLDTLYIMGLMEEYEEAKEWVQNNLDLNSVSQHSWVVLLWISSSELAVNLMLSEALV